MSMIRPSAWATVWHKFRKSLGGSPNKMRNYIGTDASGNRYYELPRARTTVKRQAVTITGFHMFHTFAFSLQRLRATGGS